MQEHAELARLRQECGQLRAQRADQAAQAQGLAAQLAAERADSSALRQENLELATELNEASMDRHATEDAHHVLKERCSKLQVHCPGSCVLCGTAYPRDCGKRNLAGYVCLSLRVSKSGFLLLRYLLMGATPRMLLYFHAEMTWTEYHACHVCGTCAVYLLAALT